MSSFFGLSIFCWNADGVRSHIVEIRDFIDQHSPDIFLLQETHLRGFFNAKHTSWGCPFSDTRGNRLYTYIVNNSIDVFAPLPLTRFGTASASIIQYALIKNLNWPCIIDSISELNSDHNPVKLHFPRRTTKFEFPPYQLKTTWSIFTKTLANIENCYLPKASSTQEIESQVRDLTSEILNAHVIASKPMNHLELPFVQGELKHLFKERNRAGKLWQFTRHPQHKTELNRLQNIIKRKVGFYRQQVWEDHLTSLDTEDGSLWGTARVFRKKATSILALNGPNGIALSDTNKTELIAQSLESQFQLNNIQNPGKDEIITNIVDTYLTTNANNIDLLPPDLPSEGIDYIKKIKVRKKNENILIPEQHGFRPRLSTTHQLLRVVEYIKESNNRSQCTAAVFLDIQKAFDRVWHTGLFFKLITYKIPPPLILLLKSYTNDRTFSVKINHTFSQVKSVKGGIAQGSILGPVLFNLCVNDIIKSTNTTLCTYADDTTILSRHKNLNTLTENINEHQARIEIWFSVWKIALNTSKTEAVFFSQRTPPPEIPLQNQRIP
ncbi:RNA-directed DNA polymerase from mobile element jockey [Trichonephila clavipes]|nr:RNA-directed DNA polymerase from mobile element jockey [Trichonephila clavipes]